MLIEVTFAFSASYYRPRGRVPIYSDFLSDETVEIAEIQASEAEVAYRIEPAKSFKMLDGAFFRRPTPRSVMHWQNRLYWPVLNDTRFCQIDAARWRAELSKAAGRHTDRERRTGYRLPDVLALTDHLQGRRWPTDRMEAVPMREVIGNYRETAASSLRREAARLLMIGDDLYREGPEPVWVIQANINHFDMTPQPLRLDAGDEATSCLIVQTRPHEPPVPFLNYEIFRADRESDARTLIDERLMTNLRRKDCYRADDRWLISGKYAAPARDTLTPMLQEFHDCIGEIISWSIETLRREKPSLKDATDPEIAALHGPDYLKRLANLTMLAPGASARRLSGWISEVLQRLDGVDTRVDVFGHAETVLRGLRRAVERADHDIANGLVPLTKDDHDDQEHLVLLDLHTITSAAN